MEEVGHLRQGVYMIAIQMKISETFHRFNPPYMKDLFKLRQNDYVLSCLAWHKVCAFGASTDVSGGSVLWKWCKNLLLCMYVQMPMLFLL